MKKGTSCFLVVFLATVLTFALGLPVTEADEGDNGEVRFRGVVVTEEAWGDTVCYGSYYCRVLFSEVMSDPNNLLSDPYELLSNSSLVFIAYGGPPLNLTVGEFVECYGYYYYLVYPLQCGLTIVCGPWLGNDDYYVVRASLLGDVNHDSNVDIFDIVLCAGAYGSTPSDSNWNIYCDIASPYWTVDIFDIVAAAGNYGESC